MKGNIQIIIPVLTVFAVLALFVISISTQSQFSATITSSQQEELDEYQSKLYMHSVLQDRGLIDEIGRYTSTGNQDTEDKIKTGFRNILGDEASIYSYRAAFKEAGTLNSGENTLEVTNNNKALHYTRILVPSPKPERYELELGSEVR